MADRGYSDAAWETVQIARHPERPQTLDYIAETIPDFLELSGDRLRGDDKAIVAGLGTLGKQRIVLIGHQKGHTLKERQERSFGMTRPEGYRKGMRLARLAEKFGLPVVTLVDTPGAYPGKDAEEGGQASAIARSIETFAGLKVPTVTVVIGEVGRGRPSAYVGELLVLGHLSRGMRGTGLARRRRGPACGRCSAAHRSRPVGAGSHRRRGPRAPRRGAHRLERDREACHARGAGGSPRAHPA